MQHVFGKNVKVSLPKSYHSVDATEEKILVLKGVSTNLTTDDFKELLKFNKITHAEAERMTSKRSSRDLPFIKIKCHDLKQAEALISGGIYMPENKHNFQGRGIWDNALDPTMFQVPRFCTQGTKLHQKAKMCCVW